MCLFSMFYESIVSSHSPFLMSVQKCGSHLCSESVLLFLISYFIHLSSSAVVNEKKRRSTFNMEMETISLTAKSLMEAASQTSAPFIFATQVEHVCPIFKVERERERESLLLNV